jgi:hypothetical protein
LHMPMIKKFIQGATATTPKTVAFSTQWGNHSLNFDDL